MRVGPRIHAGAGWCMGKKRMGAPACPCPVCLLGLPQGSQAVTAAMCPPVAVAGTAVPAALLPEPCPWAEPFPPQHSPVGAPCCGLAWPQSRVPLRVAPGWPRVPSRPCLGSCLSREGRRAAGAQGSVPPALQSCLLQLAGPRRPPCALPPRRPCRAPLAALMAPLLAPGLCRAFSRDTFPQPFGPCTGPAHTCRGALCKGLQGQRQRQRLPSATGRA